MKHVCLALTGASGAPYAWRLLEQLVYSKCRISLLISRAAEVVLEQEMAIVLPKGVEVQNQWFRNEFNASAEALTIYGREDWFASVASGSAQLDAMVICPASGGTLSAIAHGASNNLIERAADVCLKERRKLLVVPREMPYSEIHLRNMLRLTQMGTIVLPASPGFYSKPQSIQDLVDFVVARILDQLGINHTLLAPWGQQ